ncbi:glyoxalase [Actinomycetospora sp. NBRC 106375]|uniref:VOC family protein n=1 Tax=Actinomycetospora sp. NBRC 106375 TaxID=3032207 RepID=UPI0024A06D68|nr:VOC family protein [Actinomycetospora sp. NBRC 106375]GLZ45442.1 glyoxalase [Actinomycetospora sp. NBRC 106375]
MRSLFVNLQVADVAVSRDFFGKLGFSFNEAFSGEQSLAVTIADNISVLLATPDHFAEFVVGDVADAQKTTEVLLALSADSREEVDQMVSTALSNGGREWKPAQDHGFMYGGSFADPDGHVWEVVWMDPSAMG